MFFIVTKEGVYRHEIIGLFTYEPEARAAAEAAASAESDDYHTFDLLKAELAEKETDEWLIATLKRKDEYHHEKVNWPSDEQPEFKTSRRVVDSFALTWREHA